MVGRSLVEAWAGVLGPGMGSSSEQQMEDSWRRAGFPTGRAQHVSRPWRGREWLSRSQGVGGRGCGDSWDEHTAALRNF